MTILEGFKYVITQMTASKSRMIYKPWHKLNEDIDVDSLPCILIVQWASGGFDVRGGGISDRLRTFVAFIDRTTFELDSEENETIIQGMRILAKDFISAYNGSGKFEVIVDIPYDIFYDGKLDASTTGIVLEFISKPMFNVSC